jgi:uncharacterized protein YhbP (UPF0306 family)
MDKKPEQPAEWKQYLAECLDVSQFMALATTGPDGAWASPVFFGFDEHFTLYFLSEPSCVHMQNIERDPRVSCAIFATNQDPHGKVLGIQLAGKAAWVSPEEAERACAAYFKQTPARHPINQANRPEEYAKPATVWRMAKVTPEHVWTFDEKNFGGSRLEVPPEAYRA